MNAGEISVLEKLDPAADFSMSIKVGVAAPDDIMTGMRIKWVLEGAFSRFVEKKISKFGRIPLQSDSYAGGFKLTLGVRKQEL